MLGWGRGARGVTGSGRLRLHDVEHDDENDGDGHDEDGRHGDNQGGGQVALARELCWHRGEEEKRFEGPSPKPQRPPEDPVVGMLPGITLGPRTWPSKCALAARLHPHCQTGSHVLDWED